ncbi:hypothetical protein [Flavisphingomonas formosensis]|uniref:hypothetical protein n=1 Tax=Flavisphingomonas formosensis TaxID=861534 RepID=UPI0012FC3C71|nr:hypothetical protein [Sphingomonas formosensis]
MTPRSNRCETCRWWAQAAAPLANAVRNAVADQHVGTCQLYPPDLVNMSGQLVSRYPETTYDRFCSHWEEEREGAVGGDPDPGERAPQEVVVRWPWKTTAAA